VWILVVCLARLALGRETDASRSREARRIRRALLEHAFRLRHARIGAEETGRLISLLTDSVERVVEYRQAYIGEFIGAVATPFLVLVGALIDPVAALVLVACIPFVPLSIALFQRFVRDDSSASREMRARLSAQFLEAIQGLSTLVGIGAADRVGERLARTGEDNRLAVMRVLARNQLILFVMEGVFSLFLVTAAIVVSWIRPPR
jgi:ABC transporter related protein